MNDLKRFVTRRLHHIVSIITPAFPFAYFFFHTWLLKKRKKPISFQDVDSDESDVTLDDDSSSSSSEKEG